MATRGHARLTHTPRIAVKSPRGETDGVHLVGLGSVLLGAQADLALWADDGNKDVLEAVLIAHADGRYLVLTQHWKQWPNAVERHA